jgi:hypothetical protein
MGTTIPGSTIGSLTNNTGTVLPSAINPPKLSLMRSTWIAGQLFPTGDVASGQPCRGEVAQLVDGCCQE